MISKLFIENFKSIRELHLAPKRFNLLIGPASSGKSNLLDFFDFIRNIYTENMNAYCVAQGGADSLLHFGAEYAKQLRGRVEFEGIHAYHFNIVPHSEDSLLFLHEGKAFKPGPDQDWDKQIISNSHQETYMRRKQKGPYFFIRGYLKQIRLFSLQHIEKVYASAKCKDHLVLREDGRNLAAILLKLEEKSPEVFKEIESTFRKVVPQFQSFVLTPVGDEKEAEVSLRWRAQGGKKILSARHLSTHSLRFLVLFTLLSFPNTPNILLLDAPTEGLAAEATELLIAQLKRIKEHTQTFIATQDSQLIQAFEEDEFLGVCYTENEASTYAYQTFDKWEAWQKGNTEEVLG